MSVLLGALPALMLTVASSNALAQSPRPAARAPVQLVGTVAHVSDGDSLRFAPADGGAPLEVRLQGIDAPEICQPWGPQAREALQELVAGRSLTLVVKGRDDHGRLLGRLLREGMDVGERLVRDGHAWSYRYRHDRGPFVAQERMAQALSRGLHAGGGAVMPREFRRTHGPCKPPAAPAAAVSAPGAATVATGTVLTLRTGAAAPR